MGFAGFLKQSTAVDVLLGPFVDSTDGDTEEVALTIEDSDVRLSKNGQTAGAKADITNAAHDADGFYNCELDATDTNTVGTLALYVHVAGALAVRHDFQVVEQDVYEFFFATGSTPDADVAAILADTGELQVDDIPGLIAALNNISSANVNTEVVDVLKTDTLTATPQGAPPTTPTFEEAVMIVYDALVHKVKVDATGKEFSNNAGTVIWKKALSDDGTDYIEAESASGP